jgi:hypothetical protein
VLLCANGSAGAGRQYFEGRVPRMKISTKGRPCRPCRQPVLVPPVVAPFAVDSKMAMSAFRHGREQGRIDPSASSHVELRQWTPEIVLLYRAAHGALGAAGARRPYPDVAPIEGTGVFTVDEATADTTASGRRSA